MVVFRFKMATLQPLLSATVLLLLLELVKKGRAIDCFECMSLNGNDRDCEDEFGPYNLTGKLIKRNCKVGYLGFKAFYCVKIKGEKASGETILLRTCSVENWGTQCGNIMFEQGHEEKKDPITGCLASCDLDGCNAAPSTAVYIPLWTLACCLTLTLFL